MHSEDFDSHSYEEAASGPEALAILRDMREKIPDVLITEFIPMRWSLASFMKSIKKKYDTKLPVVVLTSLPESDYGMRALKMGVRGFVNDAEDPSQLVAAIHQVHEGQFAFSKQFLESVTQAVRPGQHVPQSELDCLSDREFEVFHLIGGGLTMGEIAERLSTCIKTVESDRYSLRRKLGFESSASLIHRAIMQVARNGRLVRA